MASTVTILVFYFSCVLPLTCLGSYPVRDREIMTTKNDQGQDAVKDQVFWDDKVVKESSQAGEESCSSEIKNTGRGRYFKDDEDEPGRKVFFDGEVSLWEFPGILRVKAPTDYLEEYYKDEEEENFEFRQEQNYYNDDGFDEDYDGEYDLNIIKKDDLVKDDRISNGVEPDEEEYYRKHGEDGFDVWKDGTSDEIWYHLGCEPLEGVTVLTQIYDQSTWEYLHATYRKVVPPKYSRFSNTAGNQFSHGFKVKYEVKVTPGKGRGVFAAEDIPMGTLIWTSVNTAQFYVPSLYRDFLRSLPVQLACDIQHWTYPTLDSGDYITLCTDLDEGSLINGHYIFDGPDDGPDENVAVIFEAIGCNYQLFSLGDIEAGEEFIADYGDFVVPQFWSELGLDVTE